MEEIELLARIPAFDSFLRLMLRHWCGAARRPLSSPTWNLSGFPPSLSSDVRYGRLLVQGFSGGDHQGLAAPLAALAVFPFPPQSGMRCRGRYTGFSLLGRNLSGFLYFVFYRKSCSAPLCVNFTWYNKKPIYFHSLMSLAV